MQPTEREFQSPFTKILFATDFSVSLERSFTVALHLCQTNDASLCILHAYTGNAASQVEAGLPMGTEISDIEALRMLSQLGARAQQAGVRCKTGIKTGVASAGILEAIEADGIDLTILGTGEPRGSTRLVFGPTAEAVMRKTSCPIMTIGPAAEDLIKVNAAKGPVVFATDFHSITREAIRTATSYSKRMGLQLHCLHVLPRTLRSTDSDQTLLTILISALKHLVKSSGIEIDLPVCSVTFGSEISNSIVEYARNHQASLIFLGVRRSSMVASDDRQPIAFRIITEAPCPVVTIVCDAQSETLCTPSAESGASPLHLS